MNRDIHYSSLTDVSSMLKRRDISPIELTRSMFDRINAHNPRLKTYVCLLEQSAYDEAKKAEQEIASGLYRGPLHGVPIAVKDIFDIKGVPTTGGMSIHTSSLAKQDATVVRRLREAGAVLLGKLALTEGVFAEHRLLDRVPKNPWNEHYWPGASSSGSGVAVASGLCFAALSSETGGSIRLPSAANGVTGIKPTWGRVSRHGAFELAASLDHVGTMARSVNDAAAVLQVIAGPDDADPTASQAAVPDFSRASSFGVEGLRVGVDYSWLGAELNAATEASLKESIAILRELGADIREIAVPNVDEMIWDWFTVCAVQTAVAHEATYPSKKSEYGPALAALIEQGNALSGCDLQRALLRRSEFAGRMAALFTNVDVVALPVLANGVQSLESMSKVDDNLIAELHRFTCPFNMASLPSVTVQNGVSSDGLPIVFQFIGSEFSEATIVRVGNAYQSATTWHHRHPAF